jgi:hypothetical protein
MKRYVKLMKVYGALNIEINSKSNRDGRCVCGTSDEHCWMLNHRSFTLPGMEKRTASWWKMSDALGAGKSVEEAFNFGCNAIQLFDIPGHLVPRLLKKGSVEPPTGEKIERLLDVDGESGTTMKGNVFISYCSEDFKHVLEVRKKLEKAGLTVRMGAHSILGGEEWRKELVRLICKADVFVACISSTWVDREIFAYWAPKTQHRPDFPGWGHPKSLLAILCSVLAGVICIVCNIWFMKCARKKAENLSQRPERFYFLSVSILLFALVTSFLLLLPTAQYIPAVGDKLPRVGQFQVFKSLLFIGLEIFVLFWPSWFHAVWVRCGMVYERPALLAPSSKQIVIMALVAILGLGMLQWISLKNPHEVGYNDLWRTIHIEVQGILMIALTWTAWWLRYIAERLERKGNKLREQYC